jgi:urease accessory protein
VQLGVDDEARRARRPLIDCEDHAVLTTRQVLPPPASAAPEALPPGHGALSIALVSGRSAVVERRASSPLRLLCPKNAGCAAWTYTSTFGGGLVDGDDVRLQAEVEDGASALLATQASTKAYPASAGARQAVEATVGAGSVLVVLSDPLVPFAGARVDSLLDVRLAEGATLVAVEGLAAGRVATGERWAAARCQTRLRIRREGVLLLDDALLLDRAHGDVPARMGPFDAWANVVLAGPAVLGAAEDLLRLARPRRRLAGGAGAMELGSPIEGGCLVRIAATSTAILSARVRQALACVAPLLGDDPFTRRW